MWLVKFFFSILVKTQGMLAPFPKPVDVFLELKYLDIKIFY